MEKLNGFFFLHKSIAGLFPIDRSFTEVEALVSFELDRNNGKDWSYRGYEKLWGWTYKKTRTFIDRLTSAEGLQQIERRKVANPVHVISSNQGISRVSAGYQESPANPGNDKSQGITRVSPGYHTINTDTEITTIYPEQQSSEQEEKIEIPLQGGSCFTVTKAYLHELQDSFRTVNVHSEILACRQWNRDNPARRKTNTGIKRHITSWMTRKQGQLPQKAPAPVNDCPTCQYNQGDFPCKNIGKPGYPKACQSFNPVETR